MYCLIIGDSKTIIQQRALLFKTISIVWLFVYLMNNANSSVPSKTSVFTVVTDLIL